ncbi:MAG TPA: tetratricopeptide repeat protein [Methanotrichaceae archaeon]|nr:tetratricopeptide repeat protein [Methanotrichaceae archaeon]
MKSKFIIAMFVIAVLCASALAQENTADSWYKKGQELDRNGSWDEAVEAYHEAIEMEPNNSTFYIAEVPALNLQALITKNLSKYNESLAALNRALQIDPKNPRAWDLLGTTLSQTKRYNESLAAYNKGIECIEGYRGNKTDALSTLWLSKAIALWQIGRNNESLKAIDKSIGNGTENYDAWVMKGQVLAYLGRYNESIQAFNQAGGIGAAKSEPELEAIAWTDMGYPLMARGRYEEARAVYENITELNYSEEGAGNYLAAGWQGLGYSLAKLGRYNDSLSAFNKTLELSPERAPYAWIGTGDDLRLMGMYEDAVKAYDAAIQMEPRIGQAWMGLGDSLAKLGKDEESLEAYNKAIEAYDENINSFNNATALDKAISFTFDPYPLDASFWQSRGRALKALGRLDEADAAYAKAKELGYKD